MTRPRSISSAKSRASDFERNESQLSRFSKPDQIEGETKGQYAWRLIRHSIRDAIDLVTKADARDVVISHGIHHNRSLSHIESVSQVLCNKTTKDYVTISENYIQIHGADGRKKDIFQVEESISHVVYAKHIGLYVGWKRKTEKLVVFIRPNAKLLNHNFKVSSISEAPGPILSCVYNDHIGEIITIGPGYFTNWVFRYGGRHLLPRKTVTDGLEELIEYSHLVLEETASRTQRAYAASNSNVAVFNVYEGNLLEVKRELHVREITALLFFNPLKYLVTASKDGSIKVWNEQWHLQLVFVGHDGKVTGLAHYPYGPLIMSCSVDQTMRVWSLETCDEVDIVASSEPINSIVTCINHDSFSTLSDDRVDMWEVQHIHTLHARIGFRVVEMKSTDHPNYPVRSVLLCKDSSVRILSPPTGDIVTTLLMKSSRGLVDAAYAIEYNLLFATFANGDVIKSSTTSNPCTILAEWKCTDPKKACNYLLVYEYVISADIASDTWGAMKRAIATKGLAGDSNTQSFSANRTLLLGGRKDGHICVFNMETGGLDFEIEAHGSKGVLSMIANSKNDQLISSGLDNIIKVWRLFPYAQESLAPLMSFYCAHTPVYMTVMRGKLGVAFQDHTTATYNIVMYNLEKKNRCDHTPEDDHLDTITGLVSCPKMKLMASTSEDNTLRIWNENNFLIRLIKLSAQPHSLAFCSSKGDLLVGIGNHVHLIEYKSYIPKSYKFRMISMQFPKIVIEKPIQLKTDLIGCMNKEDLKRLKAASSSFNRPRHGWCDKSNNPTRFTHFMDLLTDDETEEVMKEKRVKEEAFIKLTKRDHELELLRDGALTANRKPKSTPDTKQQAFDKYLKIFYDRPTIKLPNEEEKTDDDRVKEILKGPPEPVLKKYVPEKEPTGFFPPLQNARQSTESEEGDLPPIKPDCFVPNSVIVRLLWPQQAIEDAKKPDVNYRPPGLTESQLNQIQELNKQAEEAFRDTTIVLSDDDEDDWMTGKTTGSIKDPLLTSKVAEMLSKVPTPPPLTEPTPEPEHIPIPPPPKQKMVQKITKPLVRFGSKPSKEVPKPWTMSAFINMLVRVLKIAEYQYKTDIIYAILLLHNDEGIPHVEMVQKAILSLLGPKMKAPNCIFSDQKEFIKGALQLLKALDIFDINFYTEMMVQFMESDIDVRRMCIEILKTCGMKDDNGYFTRELDTWDVWNLDDDDRPHELRKMCHDWLNRWMASFKIHVEDTIDKLKKGQNVHGRISKNKPSQGQGILKPNLAAKDGLTKTLSVTFDRPPDVSTIENATYIEAINYFCDMTQEKELEKMRGAAPPTKHEESTKNTVLVLPKLPGKPVLVRLGETHTSKCRASRETSHNTNLHLPPVTTRGNQPNPGELFAFPNCVNLPLKTVYMNPFPCQNDALELLAQQPVLLTLKSAQKYFVPTRSYVPPEYY